jgi:hypothetical protein
MKSCFSSIHSNSWPAIVLMVVVQAQAGMAKEVPPAAPSQPAAQEVSAGDVAQTISDRRPTIEWQAMHGGTGSEELHSVRQTDDGGYMLAGWSNSNPDGNRTAPRTGGPDFWVVRLDSAGGKIWDRAYGPGYLMCIENADDGGFLLAGDSFSGPGPDKTSPLYGADDAWLVRLDQAGRKLWDVSFGGSDYDFALGLQRTSDGGFILGAGSASGVSGNKATPAYGSYDVWLLRLDAGGNKLWEQCYGGTDYDFLYSIKQTSDGGFVLAGVSRSEPSGTKTSPRRGAMDGWVVRLDPQGQKLWEQTYGGTNYSGFIDIQELPDYGFIAVGHADYGVGGTKTSQGYGSVDVWVVRLDAAGRALWDRSYGGTDFDAGIRVAPMQDGGFMVAGDSQSPVSGSRTSPGSGNDFWLVRLDAAGNQLYDVALDGGGNEVLRDFRRTADGGFLCAGESFPGAYFMNDYFVVKLSPEPMVWDSDGDGVSDDSDQCPNTEPDSVVDASGCSLAQLCPPDGPWRNHGDYVGCVRVTLDRFVREGRLTREQAQRLFLEAVHSTAGKGRLTAE